VRSPLLPAAVALAIGLTGCATHKSAVIAGPVKTSAPGQSQAAGAVAPVTAPSQEAAKQLSPSPTQPPAPTYDVKAVQRQLSDLHYYAGAIDGERGPAFASAVMAFQKVQDIGADGVVGKATLTALKAPRSPAVKGSSPLERIEVDLTKQVLYVVKAGVIARVLPVSSGNGATYLQKNGHPAKALSPVGWYRIERVIRGPHVADLGTLYDPQFFYRGWAIHGSDSVPPYPASHGCIRVTRADAKYLLTVMSVGTSVYVYGGSYTFPAGSAAPGTDSPTGDTSGPAPASPTPTRPSVSASPSPRASTTPSPAPSASQSPSRSPAPRATSTPTP
jgi:lipoprotein-anchoring transpeptidase ErfK/SrfK